MSTVGVEIVVVTPNGARAQALHLTAPARVGDAVAALEALPEGAALSVWGRPVAPDEALQEGDRVEVTAPLACDPRSVRRARAKRGVNFRAPGVS